MVVLATFSLSKGKWVTNNPYLNLDLHDIVHDGAKLFIQRLRSNEAAKMLGIWLVLDRNRSQLIITRNTTALEWGEL